ncbi:cytidine deaminase [Paenibacillus radicis (ex Gao et al. 2016)]|uniref:Cytidine deaminase n=1 Tax=Paenibacillus radicis (ex Gao et al. 2016) TaxID=1737354 RepID=A0A917GT86_9BACL|nr:cytidine deaminase [Paenibacillus radicis (ex Gao et al. 2016)]GGG56323.1 cytidine deaminase [Paenibacillus radicis (ex Gao et al. 2016)]
MTVAYEGLSEDYNALLADAKEAMTRAYTPYSHFQVGAALLDDEGRVHYGCNIENAAYGPTNCAERTALFSAIANGLRPGKFKAIAVIGRTDGPIAPCGVCRQVLVELCPPDMPVVMGNMQGDWAIATVSELLPGAFTPASLDSTGL